MTKRMLIDATHPEETRVVVLQDQHLVDFDFESSTKKQLKGNIYLAKVTRVEPSLQAAFVEYGGNRHGFLAFSEIHPDYFQIPQADRELLAKLERESAEADSQNGNGRNGRSRKQRGETSEDNGADGDANGDGAEDVERPIRVREDSDEETAEVMSEQARRRARLLRSYKIQEVVKRRQIMLVQVVKEERGNKGAALTTYMSLAGRYCVLMPNTARGGGISRKISSSEDRSKLKAIVAELDVPQGMGLIVRTAGQQRSRTEIKRDYDYLMRLWSDIRDTTLKSVAPALIYEEGDLVKRAMRDLYSRDIDEVLVEGEEAHKTAKRLMTMMMPSRARHVKLYKEELPLFFKFKVEDQLDAMHSPIVQLPSGGSIVMHATEALIAIDVNSGKSTRERHIDETAVKTNLEAADEIARQLRLRDLAGLVVIDFIDMGEMRHQRAVERRVKDALKIDRARIQLGKISMFGLLELSRQRLRPSLQELSSRVCPTCQGLGSVRSTESCALQVLRVAEEAGIRGEAKVLRLTLPNEVALYLLNQKRDGLVRVEQRYAMRVEVVVDPELTAGHHSVEILQRRAADEVVPPRPAVVTAPVEMAEAEEDDAGEEAEASEADESVAETTRPGDRGAAATEEDEDGSKRRRRRRRRRRRPDEASGDAAARSAATPGNGTDEGSADEADQRSPDEATTVAEAPADDAAPVVASDAAPSHDEAVVADEAGEGEPPVEAKKPRRRRRVRRPVEEASSAEGAPETPRAPLESDDTASAPAAAEPAALELVAATPEPALEPAPEPRMAEVVEPVAPEPAPVEAAAAEAAVEQGPEPAPEPVPEAAPEPAPAAPEPPAQAEREMALVEETAEPQPARQGWWSRWVR